MVYPSTMLEEVLYDGGTVPFSKGSFNRRPQCPGLGCISRSACIFSANVAPYGAESDQSENSESPSGLTADSLALAGRS